MSDLLSRTFDYKIEELKERKEKCNLDKVYREFVKVICVEEEEKRRLSNVGSSSGNELSEIVLDLRLIVFQANSDDLFIGYFHEHPDLRNKILKKLSLMMKRSVQDIEHVFFIGQGNCVNIVIVSGEEFLNKCIQHKGFRHFNIPPYDETVLQITVEDVVINRKVSVDSFITSHHMNGLQYIQFDTKTREYRHTFHGEVCDMRLHRVDTESLHDGFGIEDDTEDPNKTHVHFVGRDQKQKFYLLHFFFGEDNSKEGQSGEYLKPTHTLMFSPDAIVEYISENREFLQCGVAYLLEPTFKATIVWNRPNTRCFNADIESEGSCVSRTVCLYRCHLERAVSLSVRSNGPMIFVTRFLAPEVSLQPLRFHATQHSRVLFTASEESVVTITSMLRSSIHVAAQVRIGSESVQNPIRMLHPLFECINSGQSIMMDMPCGFQMVNSVLCGMSSDEGSAAIIPEGPQESEENTTSTSSICETEPSKPAMLSKAQKKRLSRNKKKQKNRALSHWVDLWTDSTDFYQKLKDFDPFLWYVLFSQMVILPESLSYYEKYCPPSVRSFMISVCPFLKKISDFHSTEKNKK